MSSDVKCGQDQAGDWGLMNMEKQERLRIGKDSAAVTLFGHIMRRLDTAYVY